MSTQAQIDTIVAQYQSVWADMKEKAGLDGDELFETEEGRKYVIEYGMFRKDADAQGFVTPAIETDIEVTFL